MVMVVEMIFRRRLMQIVGLLLLMTGRMLIGYFESRKREQKKRIDLFQNSPSFTFLPMTC
jgi:hypothetical protein